MDASRRIEVLEGDVVAQLEEFAAAFGFDDGDWTLEVRFRGGHYEKAYFHRGPVAAVELRALSDTLLDRARQAR